jgi:peptidoglycan/xylan/chitin deacetylase (PgdA/CDA1 family)
MPAIMWSVDTLDWKTRNPSKTLASVKRDTKDGAIILMHDIHSPTADAVEPVVKHLLMQGFQLVTVSDLIKYRQGHAVSGKVYNSLAPR